MSIVRAPRPKGNFYILDKRISEDCNLSWGARGMLIFLLGKPDNWRVSIQNLVNETSGSNRKSGRDAVYAFLAELKDAGYITVFQNRSESGAFGETDYLVHEHSEPITDNPESDIQPLTVLPDTARPDTATPNTGKPNTADPTLISTKNHKLSTTTTERSENSDRSSRKILLEALELEFDQSDYVDIPKPDLAAVKPQICEWVLAHPEKSVQDWIYYYASSAQFEAKRGRPIQRPSAFIHAILENPVQDWTQVNFIKTSKSRELSLKIETERQEAKSRLKAAQEAKSVSDSLAIFYELSPDRQQELVTDFRRNHSRWSKLDMKSRVFQHVLADWLRENHEYLDTEDLHTERRASPGELTLKQ